MFKPLLAAPFNENIVSNYFKSGLPLMASPKLDGIRATIREGKVLTRSLKPIPNLALQEKFKHLEGFDGEFIFGDPCDPLCYNKTFSAVMTIDASVDGVDFHVFDSALNPEEPFVARVNSLGGQMEGLKFVKQTALFSIAQVLDYETQALTLGFEGIMLRKPSGLYKFGRSTEKELTLMKVKRDHDEESEVLDIYEAFENTNQEFINELGYKDRSSHAENKLGKGIVGGFILEKSGQRFGCSAGKFTHEERKEIWENREKYLGKLLKYRHFPYGVLNLPRHARALGWRDELDT